VLESYHQSHHLKKLIPWLIGKRPKAGADNTGETDALKERLKLHYVGMTRPSHLLCLAMRKDAFKPAELELMRERNWLVIECTAPSSRGAATA
jgi:ATP-dependent exoDNAse (exonuclease V) beta subunit